MSWDTFKPVWFSFNQLLDTDSWPECVEQFALSESGHPARLARSVEWRAMTPSEPVSKEPLPASTLFFTVSPSASAQDFDGAAGSWVDPNAVYGGVAARYDDALQYRLYIARGCIGSLSILHWRPTRWTAGAHCRWGLHRMRRARV